MIFSRRLQKSTSPEALLSGYQAYRTVSFNRDMRRLLRSPRRLDHPSFDFLLFCYVNDCHLGGTNFLEQLPKLVSRGSKIAGVTLTLLADADSNSLRQGLSSLSELANSNEQILRFLARVDAKRSLIDQAIGSLGIRGEFRTFENLDCAPSSFRINVPKWEVNPGRLETKRMWGWAKLHPVLTPITQLKIARLRGVVSYGGSSLLTMGDRAKMPFDHFTLASENVLRNDSLFIALGPGYIISRNPPQTPSVLAGSSVSLASADSQHFGHFVLENLPRLRAFNAVEIDASPTTVVVDKTSAKFSSLIQSWRPNIALRIVERLEPIFHEKLLLAEATSFVPGDLTFGSPFLHPESRPTSADLHWGPVNPRNSEGEHDRVHRIALLRGKTGAAPYRQLLNGEQLEAKLTDLDFTLVGMNILRFRTLKPLLEKSEFIVTELGASVAMNLFLVNLTGKKILLLQHPQLGEPEHRMAGRLAALGAHVFVIKGQSQSPERQSDYTIGIRDFSKGLKRLLSS